MVKLEYGSTRLEIQRLNLVSYLCAIIAFLLFFFVSVPGYFEVWPIHADASTSQVLWTHIVWVNLWSIGILWYVPAVVQYIRPPGLSEAKPLFVNQESLSFNIDFYIARADSMDRSIHYLRSGISILLAVFTAVILWILNLSDTIGGLMEALLFASICVAGAAVVALLISFGDQEVFAYGNRLSEDLIPQGQTDKQYVALLREILIIKRDMSARMKKWIALGLLGFVVVLLADLFLPVLTEIPEIPSEPWVNILYSVSVALMVLFFLMMGITVLGILGMRIMAEEKTEEAP